MEKFMELLNSNTVMHLATCSDDKPRSSIMEYVMIGDKLFFGTDPGSIKGKNLAKNKNVSLTVGGMPTYLALDGKVVNAVKKDSEEYFKILFKRYPHFKELVEGGVIKLKVFRVVMDTVYLTSGNELRVIKVKK